MSVKKKKKLLCEWGNYRGFKDCQYVRLLGVECFQTDDVSSAEETAVCSTAKCAYV